MDAGDDRGFKACFAELEAVVAGFHTDDAVSARFVGFDFAFEAVGKILDFDGHALGDGAARALHPSRTLAPYCRRPSAALRHVSALRAALLPAPLVPLFAELYRPMPPGGEQSGGSSPAKKKTV